MDKFYDKLKKITGENFKNKNSYDKFAFWAKHLRRFEIPDRYILEALEEIYEYSILEYKTKMGTITLKPEE